MVSKISLTTSNRSSISTVTTFAVMILSRVIVAPNSEPTHTMRDPSIGDQMMGSRIRAFLAASAVSAALAASLSLGAEHASPGDATDAKTSGVSEPSESPRFLHDESKVTQGSMTIGGRAIGYQSEAGILVVHVKDPMDDDPPQVHEDKGAAPAPQPPEAGMSYVAYFRGDKEDAHRPITFLYNGGPGSSTVWLHMGAFGPKRVVTADDTHSP